MRLGPGPGSCPWCCSLLPLQTNHQDSFESEGRSNKCCKCHVVLACCPNAAAHRIERGLSAVPPSSPCVRYFLFVRAPDRDQRPMRSSLVEFRPKDGTSLVGGRARANERPSDGICVQHTRRLWTPRGDGLERGRASANLCSSAGICKPCTRRNTLVGVIGEDTPARSCHGQGGNEDSCECCFKCHVADLLYDR